MQLVCPNCGEQVGAEHINIQQLIAVCPHCDTVFQFSPPKPDAKRRKVKQPDKLIIEDDKDHLHMSFHTNFRLDRSQDFISSLIASVVFSFTEVILLGEFLAEGMPLIVPLAIGAVTLFFYYWLALIVFNQTHIDMNDETIVVARKPIPNVFRQAHEINLSDVVSIHCEETAISVKEAFDTPRYTVYAETADARRKLIITDVTEDYAYFIARRLDEYLNIDSDHDVSRLVDRANGVDAFDDYEIMQTDRELKQ